MGKGSGECSAGEMCVVRHQTVLVGIDLDENGEICERYTSRAAAVEDLRFGVESATTSDQLIYYQAEMGSCRAGHKHIGKNG